MRQKREITTVMLSKKEQEDERNKERKKTKGLAKNSEN